jgi:hypothetical protein
MHRFAIRNRVLGLGLCTLICALASGCGGEKVPPLYSVTGKVTYNGKPVPGATIVFVSDIPYKPKSKKDDGDQPPMNRPSGKTDDNGEYELFWNDDHVGVPAGKYKVGISGVEFEAGDDEDEVRPNKVPNKYSNPDKSGFKHEVKADGDNVFNFDLVD